MGKVAIIAHRGASADAPENTLAAFKLARKQGADAFELDVRQCKTGEIVVMHDATVDRTTPGMGQVARLYLEQLTALGVPTLTQALDLARSGFKCFVEVKDRSARAAVDCIRRSGRGRHVIVQSFDRDTCAEAAELDRKLRVELLCAARDRRKWNAAVQFAMRTGLRGVNTGLAAITRARVQQLQRAGLSCSVYTVNNPDDMRRMADWGVDGIITDRPALARSVLG